MKKHWIKCFYFKKTPQIPSFLFELSVALGGMRPRLRIPTRRICLVVPAVKLHRRHFCCNVCPTTTTTTRKESLIKYLNKKKKKIFPPPSQSVLFTKASRIYNSAEITDSLGPCMLESPSREDCLESIL